MRKIVMVQLLKGNRTAKTSAQTVQKPLEVYFIGENRSEALYTGEERRVYQTSGFFGNYVVREHENAYGVTFRKVDKYGF